MEAVITYQKLGRYFPPEVATEILTYLYLSPEEQKLQDWIKNDMLDTLNINLKEDLMEDNSIDSYVFLVYDVVDSDQAYSNLINSKLISLKTFISSIINAAIKQYALDINMGEYDPENSLEAYELWNNIRTITKGSSLLNTDPLTSETIVSLLLKNPKLYFTSIEPDEPPNSAEDLLPYWKLILNEKSYQKLINNLDVFRL